MYATMEIRACPPPPPAGKWGTGNPEGVVSCFGFEMSAMTTVCCGGLLPARGWERHADG
ncbi:MAG: hypothetical protein R2861_10020 [Desulfobacterales bacterium]